MKPRSRDPRIPLEDTIQGAICDLLRLKAHPRLLWWHVPNGLPSSARAVARFIRLGMRPGVPDLSLVLPGGRGAFLEVKRPSAKLSLEQMMFGTECVSLGIPWAVVRSSEEAEKILTEWGALKPPPVADARRAA